MAIKENELALKLESDFIHQYPADAASVLLDKSLDKIAEKFKQLPLDCCHILLEYMPTNIMANVCELLPAKKSLSLLQQAETAKAAGIYALFNTDYQARIQQISDASFTHILAESLQYPADSAGALMDRRILPVTANMTVKDAIAQLKRLSDNKNRVLFVVNETGHLVKFVHIQDLLFTPPSTLLADIAKNIKAFVRDIDNIEDMLEILEKHRLSDLPVVDYDGKLLGVVRYKALLKSAQEDMISDMATMVGVSKEERALSPVSLVVSKRLPWLQINLITAFLAAAVVGAFEGIIAKYTALAVLLPVVAGQSGNTGAQALAVTIRGLVLREIHIRQWPRVLFKEFKVGFINGIAVAITTTLGVYVWSRSIGLCLIIFISMIVSMVIAGIAGACTPMILTRFGLDPAQSSSIILTTITDVAGFFSFLGIASALVFML